MIADIMMMPTSGLPQFIMMALISVKWESLMNIFGFYRGIFGYSRDFLGKRLP